MLFFYYYYFLVLGIVPDVISFNREGQEIIGTLLLKNQTTDKYLSYKVIIIFFLALFKFY